MKKIIVEKKVKVWVKRTIIVPEDLTEKQIEYLSQTGGLDNYECENTEVLFETEELLPQLENKGFHTVKIYDEEKNPIYVNGKE